uniref:Immunoglobulin domain-containing protein n=1 Tax=Oryzias melastigma TaxID=30732 RepID=A0A3B3BJP7_ORYME
MASFSPLFPGLTAGDTISPDQDQLTGTEGKSLTMKYYSHPELHWYKHDSDLQAPQFILKKGGKYDRNEYIPDKRYESRTTDTSTELIITKLTLADTALYYCALETDSTVIQSVEEAVQKPEDRYGLLFKEEGSGFQSTASYQMDSVHSCLIRVSVVTWAKIPPGVCVSLEKNYRKHLTSVITNKGYCTKYYFDFLKCLNTHLPHCVRK